MPWLSALSDGNMDISFKYIKGGFLRRSLKLRSYAILNRPDLNTRACGEHSGGKRSREKEE